MLRAVLVLLLLAVPIVNSAWNSEELALYDLVEEVNTNFYDLFGIAKDASVGEIKKAYRRLSLEWHPDRNSAPDASEKFRQIVSIYEVLKSSELREKYDNVLEFGLPDWRQPIYYYRKMRKLAWYEAIIVLIAVSTIAHYLMMWAAYYEKYLVLKQSLKKSRKRDKKGEAEGSVTQLHEALEVFRPRFHDLLPFLMARGSWDLLKLSIVLAREQLSRKEPEIEASFETLFRESLFLAATSAVWFLNYGNMFIREEVPEPRRPAPVPRAPEFTYEVATDLKAVSTNNPEMAAKYMSEADESQKKQSGAPWSCEELYQLVRLSTEKFPPGI
ncbi:DnaJ domain protein [Ancylostoma ceylanicum]|uniref:DnaJ domain protein n=1 Tax=Ancylostoma ceylanicum TaxID=53326 RepID=A0A0D6LRW3_9BILA|nr:DnaJ domain protein [Ancylostoma ceylanicum]